MTQNQINYAKVQEDRRHNVVSEGINAQANVIAQSNAETNRMNAESNRISAEAARQNVLVAAGNLSVRQGELAETIRSNTTNELLVNERQAETRRSDRVNEDLARTGQAISLVTGMANVAANLAGQASQRRNTDVSTRAGMVESLGGGFLSGLARWLAS